MGEWFVPTDFIYIPLLGLLVRYVFTTFVQMKENQVIIKEQLKHMLTKEEYYKERDGK